MISPSQRPLPDNTQHSQQTNIHAPGGIRTHNVSRRAAKDLRPRPRGHWDRQFYGSSYSYYNVCVAKNRPTVTFCLQSCPIMMIYCFLGLLSLHNKEGGITATEGSGIFFCLRVDARSCILFSNL